MANIDNDEIRKIAALARLALDDKEIERVKTPLLNILNLVASLERSGDGVDPNSSPAISGLPDSMPGGVQRTREDCVTESDEREAFQKNAPAVADGFYLVPKVIE